jgi:hypothetical protein
LDVARVELDPAKVDAAEQCIDAFINKRARDREAANAVEDMWSANERRHKERRREENREAWAEYHRGLALVYHALAAEHAAKVEALIEEKC